MFSFNDIEQCLSTLPNEIKQKKLSIILPFYNEESLIASSVEHIMITLRSWNWNFEIIASNDGSTDNSVACLQKFANDPEFILADATHNFGKGRALITGYEYSTGDYILFLDSDLELPIEHVPYFFKQLIESSADVVIGSKEDPRSNLKYPLLRKLFSRSYALIVKILFGLPVTDTQTGIKLFKREVLENTLPSLVVKKFAFDIELLALAYRKQYKISSHPIVLKFARGEIIGRMSLDTVLHMFKDTLAIFWRLNTGFYTINLQKTPTKILVASFDPTNQQSYFDMIHINHINDLKNYHYIQYDIIVFLAKGDELPSFMEHAIARSFNDDKIKALYPLLYSKYEQGRSFYEYSILANLFYKKGYYPRYRPAKLDILSKDYKGSLSILHLVLRSDFLQELLAQNQEEICDFSEIAHSPYVFLIRDFEQHCVCDESLQGIKRIFYIGYWSVFTMSLAGSLFNIWWIVPIILLELSIWVWFVFSLGIRRGIIFIGYFIKKRIFS